jgi:hypothetical protein
MCPQDCIKMLVESGFTPAKIYEMLSKQVAYCLFKRQLRRMHLYRH